MCVTACDLQKSFSLEKKQLKLDGGIVWNAHYTAFGSKRSDICAQAIYLLHSVVIGCLRMSDISVIVICHIVNRRRTSQNMWRLFL